MDKMGRKPFILLNMFGALLDVLTVVFIALGAPLALVYVSSFLFSWLGLSGVVVAGYAYISDCSDAASRAKNFSITSSAVTVSSLTAPYISGALSRYFGGVSVPLGLAVILLVVSLFWVGFLVPESLRGLSLEEPKVESGDAAGLRYDNGDRDEVETIVDAGQPPLNTRDTKASSDANVPLLHTISKGLMESITILLQGNLFIMTLMHILHVFIAGGTASYTLLFFSLRFGWDETDQGAYLLASAVNRLVHLTFILPAIINMFEKGGGGQRKRTVRERTVFEFRLITGAIVVYGVGYSAVVGLTEGWQMYLVLLFEGFAAPLYPVWQSLLSKAVPETAQGKVMSTLQFLEYISGTLGFLVMSYLYKATVKELPGSTFLLCGVFALVNIILIAFIDKNHLADHIESIQRLDALAASSSAMNPSDEGESISVKSRGSMETLAEA
ncbi:hypothetical protein HDU67_007178 [Dinochytrium kinnereticum]|nr:hypothetical protein HDU67_007178 [Dinochytrium kinnereticum]